MSGTHRSDKPAVPPGGPWTRHGHAIAGVTVDGSARPPVARCGGPVLCAQCALDAEQIRSAAAHDADVCSHGRPDHIALIHQLRDARADCARYLWLVPLALLVLVGCRQSDNERLDRKVVKGVECIVVRDGMGRAKAIDCDWG